MTFVFIPVVTVTQLTSDQGSLLSSAVVSSWSTYLCYAAVSKNPNRTCNPYLYANDYVGIMIGIAITLISLGWTGFSYTAESTMGSGSGSASSSSSRRDDTAVAIEEAATTRNKK